MALDEREYRVPYRERRLNRRYLVPRVKQLKRRRWRRRLLLVLAVVIAGTVSWLLAARTPVKQQASKPPAEQTQAQPAVQQITTSTIFAVYSVENSYITDFLIVGYEKKSNSISILSFDADIYVPLLGLEIQKIGDLHDNFARALYYSIKNVFPYEISGLYRTSDSDLSADILRTRIKELFSSLAEDYPELSYIAGQAKAENVEVLPVPTELSDLGETRAIIVDIDKLRQAAEILYSDTFDKEPARGRLLVMNGSGEPGAALNASYLLIDAGFNIINIKNADSFDYLTTEVSSKDSEFAEEIIRILGVGKAVRQNAGTEVVDAVIIIGKDFNVIIESTGD